MARKASGSQKKVISCHSGKRFESVAVTDISLYMVTDVYTLRRGLKQNLLAGKSLEISETDQPADRRWARSYQDPKAHCASLVILVGGLVQLQLYKQVPVWTASTTPAWCSVLTFVTVRF